MKLSLKLVPNISGYGYPSKMNDNREILQISISKEREKHVCCRTFYIKPCKKIWRTSILFQLMEVHGIHRLVDS